jgi:uncharacterized membrane protein YhaH (DUF805 family)
MVGRAELTPFDWAVRPVKLYAKFTGRAPRAEYWWYYLGTVIAGLVAGLFDQLIHSSAVQNVLNLALFVPWMAVSVRRLHDIDRSGWWLVSLLVPIVLIVIYAAGALTGNRPAGSVPILIFGGLVFLITAITLFVFMVTPGTVGPNRYGSDPYGPDQLEEVFA